MAAVNDPVTWSLPVLTLNHTFYPPGTDAGARTVDSETKAIHAGTEGTMIRVKAERLKRPRQIANPCWHLE